MKKEHEMKFKVFLEQEEDSKKEPSKMNASIPLGKFQDGAQMLSNLFKDAGYTIYVVGGTVRDYLMSKFHDLPYKIKDVDLATNARTKEVQKVLEDAGIKQIPKGEAFGVISAIVDGEEYEIATFREESGYADRRRPSDVRASDAKNDYKRRDFTFNALFYDMPRSSGGTGKIIDFGGGKGFEDIKSKKVSAVGSAKDRFAEDPLRVLRAVRFHGVFNKEKLKDVVDKDTFEAMKKFSSLEGVSPERVQAEFVSALIKARDPRVVLHSFESIGALPYMFPGLKLDMNAVDELQKLPSEATKKVILTLAVLLRKSGSKEVRSKLNKLKYPNMISDQVYNLIRTWEVLQNPSKKEISQHANAMSKKDFDFKKELIKDFQPMVDKEVDSDRMRHLGEYEPKSYKGEDIRKQLGLEKMGPEIGSKIKELQSDDYDINYKKWKEINKD